MVKVTCESQTSESQTLCGALLGRGNESLYKWSRSHDQDVELSLIGHCTYRYIGGKYCDISIFVSIYNIK